MIGEIFMVRVNGFIDINQMLEEIGVDVSSWKNVRSNPNVSLLDHSSSDIAFSFVYHGIKYFYKGNIGKWYNPYNELLISELAKDFGIPCVDYDLAIFGDIKGTISLNYKEEGKIYISGEDIFKETWGIGPLDAEQFNNLENIWDVLECKYQDYPNKRTIIRSLVEGIISIYLFDILTYQLDRQSFNWEIVESSEGVSVAPLFDNERIYPESSRLVSLRVDSDIAPVDLDLEDSLDESLENAYNSISRFLATSSEEYRNIIFDKLWIIGEENLNKVFERIEAKTKYPMPEDIKQYYLKEYKKHREKLEEILNKENIRKR